MALNATQRRYSTYERELLAVVKACEFFRVFLIGVDFTLRTDHKALIGIFSSQLATSSRIVKWLLKLQPFKFFIEVIPGVENVVADALSRIPWKVRSTEPPKTSPDTSKFESSALSLPQVEGETDIWADALEALPILAPEVLQIEEIRAEQEADPSIWLFR